MKKSRLGAVHGHEAAGLDRSVGSPAIDHHGEAVSFPWNRDLNRLFEVSDGAMEF